MIDGRGPVDRATVNLSGEWAAAPADDDLRRRYALHSFDDSHWDRLQVPGHWQRNAAFVQQTGPVLHRRRFEAGPTEVGDRRWLTFEGILSQADVWLDESYVGDTEGSFFTHGFDVTELLADRTEHLLAVEVTSADRGAFGADSSDPDLNPGGIWAPVRVVTTGPVRILHHRAVCRDATTRLAVIALWVVLHSLDERDVTIHTAVAGHDHVLAQRVSAGENRFEWTVQVPDPELWWPHSMGDQPMHDLEIDVRCGALSSDRRRQRIGLRRVRLDDWILRVNDERLFLKGVVRGPISMWPAEAARADHEHDLAQLRDAHLDLIRVRDHIGRTDLYDVADEIGLLLWQDLPFSGGVGRSARTAARRQASEAVDLLAHHPSLVWWSGAAVFDRSVTSTLRSHDGSRPVVADSGPGGALLSHLSPTLLRRLVRGDERNLSGVLFVVPRLGRFVAGTDVNDTPASASPEAEADAIRFEIETLRRLKYRPTGGFCQFDLTHRPSSILDAVAAACRPVIAVADRLPLHIHPGDEIAVDVHVCSDLRTRIMGARIEARWRWTDGDVRQVFVGDIDADSVAFVGRTSVIAPDIETALTLDLRLTFHDPRGHDPRGHDPRGHDPRGAQVIDRRDETSVITGAHHH